MVASALGTSGSSMNPNRSSTWNTPGSTFSMTARSSTGTRGASPVSTDTISVVRCSTLLWRRLFTSAGGALPRSLNMNTAVPSTRLMSVASSSTAAIGRSPRWMRAATSCRPRRQVAICTSRPTAMSSGNQPPSGIFGTLASRKHASIDQQRQHDHDRLPRRPVPLVAGDAVEEQRGDHHHAGDGDAVGAGQSCSTSGSR